jgi:alkanesulfonate monooxygenase SsuD/methylene tetrahydromethanopterin reductase-like flavin-dependent oxidoreductase (luciferase family)
VLHCRCCSGSIKRSRLLGSRPDSFAPSARVGKSWFRYSSAPLPLVQMKPSATRPTYLATPRSASGDVQRHARGGQGLDRVARAGDGWIASAPKPDALAAARADLFQRVEAAGRDPRAISVNVQIWVCTSPDAARAESKLRRSEHFRRLVAHDPIRSQDSIVEEFRASNLLGSPDRLIERLQAYRAAGADHVGLVFLGETTDELLEDMATFGESVLPIFAD